MEIGQVKSLIAVAITLNGITRCSSWFRVLTFRDVSLRNRMAVYNHYGRTVAVSHS